MWFFWHGSWSIESATLYLIMLKVRVMYMDQEKANVKVQEVAGEIARYLMRRPNAAETVEGLATWWLTRQRFEDSKEIVQAALEHLVIEGHVDRCIVGGKVIYRNNQKLHS